ncbi:MAG: carboxypeptidase M32 [Kiloniellales bacterium]|nr:carboxypeptidase M32 [Kiloniellales bacterium]
MTAYQQLEDRFRRLSALGEAEGVLHWDMSTMMPEGGAGARSEQLAALAVTRHELLTGNEVAELLDAAEAAADGGLDPWQAANLRAMRRRWRHATALPADLVEAFSKACRHCEMLWRSARPKSDYAAVRPALEEVLRLVRQVAQAKAEALGVAPYAALLDEYEPGSSVERIEAVFDDLAGFLPGFLDEVLARQAAAPTPLPLGGRFPKAQQEVLGRRMMEAVGFDFGHGRLDVSFHPFCGGVPEDVRITTRYDEADFLSGLMAVLHETGHAMYERGLPAKWRLQPVGEAGGMALHESQSLLIEMQAARSPAFIAFMAPLAREAFEAEGPAWEVDNLIRHYHRVERGLIRVDADEVTYPLHVILRFRLERALIAGDLALDELPGAWNDGMESLLGVMPPDDSQGCLQDIHWYDGAWGYFPTYTLGALAAAQFFDAARRDLPEIPEALARGDFAPLMTWLREKVHGAAARLSSDALLEEATGRPLDPEVFKAHLRARYLG